MSKRLSRLTLIAVTAAGLAFSTGAASAMASARPARARAARSAK